MDEVEIYNKLKAADYADRLDALGELIDQSKSGIALSDRVRETLQELLYYVSTKPDPEANELEEEETRREAATLLGLYFHDRKALPSLIKFVGEKANNDYVLRAAIISISVIGTWHGDSKHDCVESLARIVLDTTMSEELRSVAYEGILELENKGKPQNKSIDIAWVKSLTKTK